MFEQELRLFRELQYLRECTRSSERSLHLLKAFHQIDRKHTGSLHKKQILSFLNSAPLKEGHFSLKEIDAIFHRLHLKGSKVSFVDLLNALCP